MRHPRWPVRVGSGIEGLEPRVVREGGVVSLIDADADAVIPGYEAIGGDVQLDLTTLPTTRLNIRANPDTTSVLSVRFGLDGNPSFRVESTEPCPGGRYANGDYAPWTPSLGAHTLKATPYSGAGATGRPAPP